VKRSRRLDRIVRLASVAEQRAALAVARAESDIQRAQAQRSELRRYQADYLKRLMGEGSMSLAGYDAQKLRVFVQRIEQAIAILDRTITKLNKRVERERAAWIAEQRRTTVIGDIAARVRGAESRTAEANLQHEIDDRSAIRREH
jgi:flagellar protein FliJ